MNRNTAIIVIVLLAIGTLVGVFYVAPALAGDAGTSMTITLYDANGAAVWEDTSEGDVSFWIGNTAGAEVVKAVVTITYSIASSKTDATITSPSTSGSLYITECFGNLDVQSATVDSTVPLSAQTELSGTYSYTLDLTTFLPSQGGLGSIEYGWKVMFMTELNAQATVDGEVLSDSWTSLPVVFQLYWIEGTSPSAGTITVDGSVSVGFT